MKRHIGVILLTMILGVLELTAQNVVFFDSKKGLSNSCVRNIYEDSRHNIWITTLNGLSRYDGVKMNVYRHELGNDASLLHDESTSVMEYDRDHLLVGTNRGVQMYDYATDKFAEVPIVTESGDTLHSRVVSISRIQKNRMMVCLASFGHGELEVAKDGSMIIRRSSKFLTGESHAAPVQFLDVEESGLWIVNSAGEVYRQTKKGMQQYGELQNARKICQSSSGKLYAVTISNGLYCYDKGTDHFRQVATGAELGGAVFGFNAWTTGKLFICTDGGGLRIYDEKTGKVTLSTIKVSDFDLATSNVKDAIYDSYGNVWVGIYWKGVMMKPVNQSAFEYVGQHSITKNTIGTNAVFAIAEAPNNKIWVVADNDGLYQLSADGISSTHWSKETNPEMPRAFTAVCNVDRSTVLLGTFFGGLWKMTDGRFSLVTTDINQIFDIQPAAEKGCYWIATVGQGFYYYNHATGTYLNYTADWSKGEEGTRILGNSYTYAVLPIGNLLFVGTSGGLTICHLEKNGIIKEASTKLLDDISVRHFAVSADGSTVWVATNGGLVRIDVKSLNTYTYTKENSGLPINGIMSLCINNGHLWMGTDFGLCCMDINTERFTTFFANDGLQGNEFSRGTVLSMNDKIYFGGVGGITFFDVKAMEQWRSDGLRLHLRLVDVSVGGKTVHQGDMSGSYEVLKGLIDDCGRIDLCHTDNHFILELDVKELNGQHVTYEYSVNGGDWADQGGNNDRIIFDNLAPGTYHIKVRALAYGTMSEERELTVTIHPAWYASIWAKMIYFLLFAVLCWLGYEYVKRRVRLRRIMVRNRQQQEMNEARVQFFMNISHEIRTPMTLILAPLEKLISSDKDADRQHNYGLIKQNAKRILRLINQMMDVRKIEQGKFLLDYRPVELVEFLQNIYDVFTTNAQSRNITYEFIHDADKMPVYVDPDNTDKIVMNLLSNAFKFTPDGGKITMELQGDGQDFEIKVTDSGVGIKDEDKEKVFDRFYSAQHQNGYIGTGIGLNLTSMLVKLHKGSISVADNPAGTGTLFAVKMPMGDESLRVIKPEPIEANVEGMESIEP
ncbi:MAG: hybrid sensor histidine kinase/response regulator [Bacteroidaceae bacterium]|nr:hybrid sensor histidine kinase/response regulator [Bacteroidaceae bacterium]